MKTRENRITHFLKKIYATFWNESLLINCQKDQFQRICVHGNNKKRLLSSRGIKGMKQINFWELKKRREFRAAAADFGKETFPEDLPPIFNDLRETYMDNTERLSFLSEKTELVRKLEAFGLVDKTRMFRSPNAVALAEIMSYGEMGI